MDRVRELLTETTRYRWTCVQLIHPDGKTMEIAGWVQPQADKIRASLALVDVAEDPFVKRVLNGRDLLVIPDVGLEPDADPRQVEATGIRTAIAAPLFDEDTHLGALVVRTFTDQGMIEPTAEELNIVAQAAALVGAAIGRLRAHEARIRAEARLARAAKAEALGRLAGGLANDFNNVLLAISANLDLARGELDGHSAVAYLDEALDVADGATTLTRQLLASSRQQPLARRTVKLGPVLERAQRVAVPTLRPTQTFERVALPESPAVLGDAELLERVFVNLLTNARDAIGPTGRVSVEVKTVRIDAEHVAAREELRTGDYALVTVSDDGAGMDADTLARAFDPYFTTKGPERGGGLGLSVVQAITEQHNGYVMVCSKVGRGTTFNVYLPLADTGTARVP